MEWCLSWRPAKHVRDRGHLPFAAPRRLRSLSTSAIEELKRRQQARAVNARLHHEGKSYSVQINKVRRSGEIWPPDEMPGVYTTEYPAGRLVGGARGTVIQHFSALKQKSGFITVIRTAGSTVAQTNKNARDMAFPACPVSEGQHARRVCNPANSQISCNLRLRPELISLNFKM